MYEAETSLTDWSKRKLESPSVRPDWRGGGGGVRTGGGEEGEEGEPGIREGGGGGGEARAGN